jgi:hypothetical protein
MSRNPVTSPPAPSARVPEAGGSAFVQVSAALAGGLRRAAGIVAFGPGPVPVWSGRAPAVSYRFSSAY